MQGQTGEATSLPRTSAWKVAGLGALVAALVGVAGLALVREARTNNAPVQSAYAGAPTQAALTPAEENYAAALGQIHAQVKQDAVRMTFAGLAYKMGDIKAAVIATRVTPALDGFRANLVRTRSLAPPASLASVHERYVSAIARYEAAAREMMRTAVDGRDEHLLKAQEMSLASSEDLLRVGDVLWPGEYRPN